MKSLSILVSLCVLWSSVWARPAPLVVRQDFQGGSGVVATEVANCSQIGVNILQAGGAAADAAIAASLCVGVIAAYHSGIGGGGFMLVRSAANSTNSTSNSTQATYEMIDFRETMPALGNETMYSNNSDKTASTIGGLAIGVPGELRGWEMLHQRHGRLPWAQLFQPAINLARNGYAVEIDLYNATTNLATPNNSFILNDPLFSEIYAPNGTAVPIGGTIKRTRYADTLEKIANSSADTFYTGQIAQNIVNAARNRSGIISMADLANYSAIIRQPNNITYRGSRLFSTVAPSSGSVVLSALKIFEGYPGNASLDDPAINLTTHRLIQATRFGYGQRTQYGDPAFTANVSSLEQQYISNATVSANRALIRDNQTYPSSFYDPMNLAPLEDHGTSHIAVIDRDGNAVSLTTTVNLYWGSQVMTEDGIILNDEMDDFSSPGSTNSFGFAPAPVNYIRPGKRPQSSIASSIGEDLETGEIRIATGSAGGSRIITATLQNLHYVLDLGYDPSGALHIPRWHDQLTNQSYFESGQGAPVNIPPFSNGTIAFLQSLGYNTTSENETGSTGHICVRLANGTFEAASDPRKAAGLAAAY